MTDLILAVVALVATVAVLLPAWPRREKTIDPLSRRAMQHLLDDEPLTDRERRGGSP